MSASALQLYIYNKLTVNMADLLEVTAGIAVIATMVTVLLFGYQWNQAQDPITSNILRQNGIK